MILNSFFKQISYLFLFQVKPVLLLIPFIIRQADSDNSREDHDRAHDLNQGEYLM